METAMARFNSTHKWVNFNQDFVINQVKIPINGLIWMGTKEFMYEQIKKKIEEGYSCLKMKVGAIDFELELELLKYIRSQFSENEMTLRVDANGAFMENTLEKLSRISEYQIHSIEQPIMKGDWEKMAYLVDKSPIDIALDEELIGINDSETKRKLLETIKPRYIILKPSLHGGYAGSQEWINLSNENNCAWWLTSALESNVGLNAISQMAALWASTTLHGLGTGQLYHVNVDPVLEVKSGFIQFGKNE
jgi:L-alanine-DL-glutamate epimerase-like enolase superfamily enzyme